MKRMILLVLMCVSANLSQAQQADQTLVVGTKVSPPFVVRETDGSLSGLSIELWDSVASDLGLNYELREVTLETLIDGLADGSLDVSVGALTVTAAREKTIDFTHPFHTTGLAIAVPQGGSAIAGVLARLFSWEFLAVLASLTGLLLLVGVVFWFAERRKNAAMFGGTPARGIGASFWWAAVTMTTVGYGDKAPVTFTGRLIALIWMFAAIILISSFTAAIATSLTVNQLESSVRGPGDLPRVQVATVAHSASATYLREKGIGFAPSPDLEAALEGVASGRFEALVYDRPILQYLTRRQYAGRLQVLDSTFERQDYALALPEDSPLRDPINQRLLEVIASDEWKELLQRYLGN